MREKEKELNMPQSSEDMRLMRERVRRAWSRAASPDDGPRADEMTLELRLHGAEIALDWALGTRECGKILMEWVRQAEGAAEAKTEEK